MKAVVFGGAGVQGAFAAKELAKRPEITRVIVADVNAEAVRRVAREIGPKAESTAIDVNDRRQVLSAMSGAKVVANFTGPGFVYAPIVVSAAVEAGVNYVDINDDLDAIPRVLAFDQAARDKGITVLCGMGVSPGMTDLHARLAADKLDRVDEVHIIWVISMIPRPTPANWGHRLSMYASQAPVLKSGKVVYVKGGTGRKVIEWPQPIGRVGHVVVSHAEIAMMPRHIKGIKEITVRGAFSVEALNKLLAHLGGELSLASTTPLSAGGAGVAPIDFMRHFMASEEFRQTRVFQQILAREMAIGPCVGVKMEVMGKKGGKKTRYTYDYFDSDRNISIYLPAAICAYRIATGQIRQPGVIFPEALEPKPIVEELAQRGVKWEERIEADI